MPKWRQVRATLPLSRSKSIQANRIRASRLSSAPVRANRSEPGGFPLRTCISTLYASVTNHSEREQRGRSGGVGQFDGPDSQSPNQAQWLPEYSALSHLPSFLDSTTKLPLDVCGRCTVSTATRATVLS